jgi:hypothetical protein
VRALFVFSSGGWAEGGGRAGRVRGLFSTKDWRVAPPGAPSKTSCVQTNQTKFETKSNKNQNSRQLRDAAAEYLETGSVEEVAQVLRDTGLPHYGHELVKEAVEVRARGGGVCAFWISRVVCCFALGRGISINQHAPEKPSLGRQKPATTN